jgi:hypothetical protein
VGVGPPNVYLPPSGGAANPGPWYPAQVPPSSPAPAATAPSTPASPPPPANKTPPSGGYNSNGASANGSRSTEVASGGTGDQIEIPLAALQEAHVPSTKPSDAPSAQAKDSPGDPPRSAAATPGAVAAGALPLPGSPSLAQTVESTLAGRERIQRTLLPRSAVADTAGGNGTTPSGSLTARTAASVDPGQPVDIMDLPPVDAPTVARGR